MSDFPFKLASSAAPADFIVKRLQDFAVNVASIIPGGFEAYARIFHPAYQVSHETHEPLRWSEVAEKTGRTCHRQMQWPHIRGEEPVVHDHAKLKEGDTWLKGPEEGTLPVAVAKEMWQILGQHTETPEVCFFAIWEGFGCLPASRLAAPAFEIPARKFRLFQAPIQAIEETFCTNDPEESRGMGVLVLVHGDEEPSQADIDEAMTNFDPADFPASQQSANLWWPKDRAWCVATEIDFDTTYIGGTQSAISAILACEALEAYQVEPTDSLLDTINPKPETY